MEGVRKALAVSIGARGFAALLGLLALPLYVRLLGIEAYGVVGLFASLQVLVAFMDMGLATTLTRELAGVGTDRARLAHGRSAALTFEIAYLCVAILIGLILAIVAPLVATGWINLETLSADRVSLSLQLAAVALACQWPANLYAGGLAGLHRQGPLALSSTAFAIMRVALSLIALWQSPTLESFFLAQIVSAVLQSAGMRIQLWSALRLPRHRAIPRIELLHRSRGFAGGMTAITVTSILLVQMDKVILSYLVPLPDFGIYVVASTLAAGLYTIISPVFSVMYPRLSALWGAGDFQAVANLYRASSQAMAGLIVPLTLVMACFPKESLYVLTGDPVLGQRGAWTLVWLVLGSGLNGLMNMPYALQLAAGWTTLTIGTNVVAVAVLAPMTWWTARHFGIEGGALAWFALNLGYLICTPQLMHRRLIGGEKYRWYLEGVVRPAGASLLIVAALWLLHQDGLSRWMTAVQLAAYWSAATLAALLSLPLAWEQARALLRFDK